MNELKSQIYLIYGRKTYPQPLEYIDALTVDDPGSLQHAADQLIGQQDWVELIAFPESAMIRVIPWNEEQ